LITALDTVSWSSELVTGNAEFIEVTSPGSPPGSGPSIFVISNVRNDSAGFGLDFGATFGSQFSFEVLQSAPFPPAPGPGSGFNVTASYTFPQPNYTFDPVAAYDATGVNPVIHIIGTRNTPTGKISSSSQYSDVIKFTYDTVAQTLAGPIVLSSGTRIRSPYDIAVLPNGNQIVAMSLAEPMIQGANPVVFVSVESNVATLILNGDITPFVPGQWVLLNGFSNATFLNGQVVRVTSAAAGEFSFAFQLPVPGSPPGSYNEPEPVGPVTAYAQPIGDSVLALELDVGSAVAQGYGYNFGESFGSNEVVPASATIIDSSPARSGNAFDGISLVGNGGIVELYYQAHPKVVTFQDQVFTINFTSFGATSPTPAWSLPAVPITAFTARYSDSRLTVLADAGNNRYLSQTYWSQSNHPYGILGNALLGYKPSGDPWVFSSALGTFMGGSIVQSTLAVAQGGMVNLVYLLQPFDQVANPPSTVAAAYPLRVATVTTSPPTLDLTNVPGFYNNANFTWLRGTKSVVDNESIWAVVGEREALTTVTGEAQTVPALPAPSIVRVDNYSGYFENVMVTYALTGVPLVEVATSPAQGQYAVEPSTGEYSFNRADAGSPVAISYSYVSGIQPVYASAFIVPPVAALAPSPATVYRSGTFYSTDTATITKISLSESSLTVTCNNDFQAGEQVAMYGIGTVAFLNGITLTVASATPAQFTAYFSPQLAATIKLLSGLSFGFGFNFGSNFSVYSKPDTGVAANLRAGALTFSAAGSTDASGNALEFFWSENDPDLVDVTLQTNSSQATLNVARKAGPTSRNFDVGVAIVDLEVDLVTQIHPALLVSNATVVGFDTITLAFAPPGGAGFGSAFGAHFGLPVPSGAVVPVAGEQAMMYGMVLTAPQAPTLGQVPGGSLPAQNNLSVIVTYVNNAGETVGSSNSILSVGANSLLTVNSPGGNGTATAYNVYVGTPGSETLQTLTPQPLGSTFIEPTSGLIASFTTPPLTSTASEVVLNDEVLTLTSVTPTTMNAPFTTAGTFGIDFGHNFNGNYSASLTGFVIAQFQFAVADVTVPQNVAPAIVFPAPLWSAGNMLGVAAVTATSVLPVPGSPPTSSNVLTVTCANSFIAGETVTLNGTVEAFLNGQPLTVISASPTQFTANFAAAPYTNVADTGTATLELARNTQITITPTPNAADPTTQFPVVYTGIYDPDDTVSYLWTQTGGTAVTVVGGDGNPSFSFLTNGVNVNGEALTFSLTASDGVNSPVTSSFTVNVAAYNFASTNDTRQLSRSVWGQTATVSNVVVASGVATITANNGFLAGEPVRFSSLANATFLNNVVGFFVASADASQFTFSTTLPDYPSTADSGTAYATMPISQRNLPQVWLPLDISILFSDLASVKRVSVTDGSDRYIVISPYSVLVYGVFPSANPVAVLLRKLLTPNRTVILDAVHTEQDYTLVLDASGNIFRYSTAPLIDTDNPDTALILSDITSISFTDTDLDGDVKIMTTQSFANNRIVVLSGEQGAVLLQLNTTTLAVQGVLEFLTADSLLYGADGIQFVRWVNMDNLHTGRVLLGSVVYNSANVTQVAIANNALTLTGANDFVVGDEIVLSGMQNATFLNGVAVKAVSATAAQFTASFEYPGNYGPVAEATGFAEAQTSGTTYETLVDLSQGQIIGTWDKSKLRNQFVQTGEILFTPDTTYSGVPTPPVLLQPSSVVQNGKTYVTLAWQQERPDLITSYIVGFAIGTRVFGVVPVSAPYTFQIPVLFTFTADEGVVDTTTSTPLVSVSGTPQAGQYTVAPTGLYTFNAAQAGHAIAVSIRQSFNALQNVGSGATQSITVLLAAGQTYFFEVQAFGLDGRSGQSNIQSISI
jgi:hypothetical protein